MTMDKSKHLFLQITFCHSLWQNYLCILDFDRNQKLDNLMEISINLFKQIIKNKIIKNQK